MADRRFHSLGSGAPSDVLKLSAVVPLMALLIGIPQPATANQDADCSKFGTVRAFARMGCGGSAEASPPASSARPAPTSAKPARASSRPAPSPEDSPPAAPSAPEPGDVGFRVAYEGLVDGGQCIKLVELIGPREASSRATSQAEAVFLRSLATIPQCTTPDGTPAPLPALASTPGIEAVRFWQTMPLPDLAPRNHPGRALVGWGTYLETAGRRWWKPTGPPPSVPSPSPPPAPSPSTGTTARDRSPDPTPASAAPWPDGDITWVYGHSGPRNIAVTQTWTADWSIGTNTGTLTGRGTTATITDFPVDQIQAVRTR